ncbi:MAG: imidazoleglycerol-phosphate dehydratase HisB [Spirochaetota bacterium]|nr:imidazoleglycerol-phosphate dehydratase HisB [Spirochaetota bacterium]
MKKKAEITRRTSETDIVLKLYLHDVNESIINSGAPFFDHMLYSMSKHGKFFLDLDCSGDYEIDDHHSIEDIGICLGMAFDEALGDRTGIIRFGHAVVPMDEALVLAAVDISGRSYFRYTGKKLTGYINRYNQELTLEFLRSFTMNAKMNVHINVLYGENSHHIHEAIFKSLGVALYRASNADTILEGKIPSTKGTIK